MPSEDAIAVEGLIVQVLRAGLFQAPPSLGPRQTVRAGTKAGEHGGLVSLRRFGQVAEGRSPAWIVFRGAPPSLFHFPFVDRKRQCVGIGVAVVRHG